VQHKEIVISSKENDIKADLKIPDINTTNKGIILSHGAIINRKSLSRETGSLAEYLCKTLKTHVITPDYLGETIHRNKITFDSFSDVLRKSVDYLYDIYGVNEVMGFGHSMGCYVLVNALSKNDKIKFIVNYGGPTKHVLKQRQLNLIFYMIRYFSKYNYLLDFKNLIKYIFDDETKDYFYNVMLKEDEFGYKNYNFQIDSSIFREGVKLLEEYFEIIKKWGKPTLLLFGSEDPITKKTKKHLPEGFLEDNILVKYIQNASHITPCMDTKINLEKLDPIIKFYKLIYNDGIYQDSDLDQKLLHLNLREY
jgi:hypothetical protein